eukprot:CAMPEP_0179453230 /NCGR_PEP_ID=MMETSP0799-20121207/37143_1 /TAXON_ID=46947 /ORGANISM="Geminigera cryophila, Strain CCMP2564" /LENGTH=152 /DNA_ID=CAMNT_0021249999 /DNA_START=33 /DNA_END=491 /DNA_ORIENTATION=-
MSSTGGDHDDVGPPKSVRPHQQQLVRLIAVAQSASVSMTAAKHATHTCKHQGMGITAGHHDCGRSAIHLFPQPHRPLPRLPVAVPQLAKISLTPAPQRPLRCHTGCVFLSSSHHDNGLAVKQIVSPAHTCRQQLVRVGAKAEFPMIAFAECP